MGHSVQPTMLQEVSECEVEARMSFCKLRLLQSLEIQESSYHSILEKLEYQKLSFLHFYRLSTLNFGTFGTWKLAHIF